MGHTLGKAKTAKPIVNLLGSHRLTRRQFLVTSAVTGMALAAADASLNTTSAAQTGGNLRFGLTGSSTTDTLNPAESPAQVPIMIGYATRGTLTEVGTDNTLKPEIIESWEPSTDGSIWRFKLRKGVQFSNGKSLGTQDIIDSLNLHRGPDSKSGVKSLYSAVTDIKADGNDVVVFTLSSGNFSFPYILSEHHSVIVPSKDGKADWQSGVGAGPYVIESFEPGVRAVLKRNPNSYKSGYIDSAELIGISDDTARQTALLGGEVDVINNPNLQLIPMLTRTKGIRVEEVGGKNVYHVTANTTLAPYSSKDVRLAMKYGVDRKALLSTVFGGHGIVGNDQPITPNYKYHDPNLAAKSYDPDKAKFHLKKAGFDNLSLKLYTTDLYSGAIDMVLLYQQQAAKAGITIDVIREPYDGWYANVWMQRPFFSSNWFGRPSEDVILSVGYSSKSPFNETFWENDRFNKLLVQARVEGDEAKRRDMYYEMQQILSDDGGSVMPIFPNLIHVVADKVQHGKIAGNFELDGGRAVSRWWINQS